ncbi:hypothetical protein PCANC_10690 [Puccinia coronata f. sp. avenae]|uniref:SAM domain-containing protein n=1 Tax=Puccinia coronata f. sp. avenae TaxID=200324 RepID=A0A2N5VG46_9BASI|nr:hypothetical protein PCASD_20314 [Puccinia coronata f. sp. avenae]PLW41292.1 hypothetical protein PCASD_10867 [Puccinia coronata f. sp. avenae]PLW48978.1 hypothetical protein PCANC_10690 [Puccinia coronata f. sp. avenae]
MIANGTSSNPSTMTWTAYILKNKKFPKSAPISIFDNVSLTQWLNKINFAQQSKGGVMIRMDNPCNEVLPACKEDLLARTMKRINARCDGPPTTAKRARRSGDHSPADSDEESSSGPEFNNLDVHSDEIYAKYGMNSDYDRVHPVFLDPTNANRYILLTSGNVDKWAKALCMQTPGVSLLSPPSSIKYLTRQKKDKLNHNDNLAPSGSNPFVDFTKWLASQKASPRSPSPPLSNYGDTSSDLADYLEFIKIAPHKREGLLNTLLHNDIDSYQMFKRLGVAELKLLGFNVGVITKLRSNVHRYKCHLSKAAQASPLL